MLTTGTLGIMGGVSLLAGFVSAIAGASGIIILPALLMIGMPPHFALGTNRLYTTASLFTSSLCFIKNGLFQPRFWIASICAAILGTLSGVVLALFLSSEFLEKILPVLIAMIAIYLLIPKKKPTREAVEGQKKPYPWLTIMISGMLGMYSGFLGAGTGSIWTSAATEFFKVDFMEASAISRFMCFVTNLVALVVFMCLHKVDYFIGLELAAFGAVGALLGARVAIWIGPKFVRYAVIISTLFMAGNLALSAWI